MKIKHLLKQALYFNTFVIAGIALLYFFDQGFAAWIWQAVALAWALRAYFIERRCYRLEKRLEIEKRANKNISQ